MAQSVSYQLRVDRGRLLALIDVTGFKPTGRAARTLGEGIRRAGLIVQTRAVRNVSGYPVVFEGGVFRVQVRTGALKGSIELDWPYEGTVFRARVYVNGTATRIESQPGSGYTRSTTVAEYAAAIEAGHKEIDLKKYMQGKRVPFFGSVAAKARGPYAARGLKPIMAGVKGYGSGWASESLNAKLAAKGKGAMVFTKMGGKAAFSGRGTSYFISFRTVGKTGWIIPEAAPRPFMRAAAMGTRDQVRRVIVAAAVEMLRDSMRGA